MFKGKKIAFLKLVPIILISFILFRLVNNIEHLTAWIKNFITYLSGIANYLICGFCIAFFLNSPMNFFMNKLRFKKVFALVLVYVILLSSLSLLFMTLIPMIIGSVSELFLYLPEYFTNFNAMVVENISRLDQEWLYPVKDQVMNSIMTYEETTMSFVATTLNNISLTSVIAALTGTTNAVFIVMFGFVLSIYMLWDKDGLILGMKKIISGLFNEDLEQRIISFGALANKVFSDFIIGKALDSVLILIICLICTTILNLQYALIISLIVGITNMIPYFGPMIGWFPCVILSLFVSPLQALTTGIFIIILQQFDGWFLGPKILSNQIGLSPILVIAGITIGGNIGGFVGMFLGVPIIALLKIIFYNNWIERRLKRKRDAAPDSANSLGGNYRYTYGYSYSDSYGDNIDDDSYDESTVSISQETPANSSGGDYNYSYIDSYGDSISEDYFINDFDTSTGETPDDNPDCGL